MGKIVINGISFEVPPGSSVSVNTCGYKDGSGVYCARPKSKNVYNWCEEHWSTIAAVLSLRDPKDLE